MVSPCVVELKNGRSIAAAVEIIKIAVSIVDDK